MRCASLVLAGFLVSVLGVATAAAQTLAPLPDLGLMAVRGRVRAIAVQADGKVVIGGEFTLVNGVRRNNIARLNADGTLDTAWNPDADLDVTQLAVSDDAVYAVGIFGRIGGQPRRFVAALDVATGAALAWDPSPNKFVSALALAGGTVYVGGNFTSIGGASRNCLAALDAATGLATAWNPSPSGISVPCGDVSAIAPAGGVVYVGGAYQNIGGQARFNLAAVDATTGNATAWNPNPSGAPPAAPNVTSLAVSGGVVYAGGQFTTIGGQPRARLAALDAATGNATAWNPSPGPSLPLVNALTVAGGVVYVGGNFTSLGGASRSSLAALDATTGAATAWNPTPDADVRALAVAGGTVHVGGAFGRVAGETTLLFARLDAGTGLHVAGFRPAAGGSGAVSSLAAQSDGQIAAAGDFRWVGKAGLARRGLLRVAADGTFDAGWDPAPNGIVLTLAAAGTTVYAGGSFASVGGEPRRGLAALDGATGNATAWNPDPDDAVAALVVDGGTVYAGGGFTTIGGAARAHLAALDAATGAATAWAPDLDDRVDALALAGGALYVAGEFTVVGGAIRIGLAAVDTATSGALAWNPNPNGRVDVLAAASGTVYAGGIFTMIGGAARRHLAALDATTGAATGWDPDPDGTVATLVVDGATVYAGGAFTSIGGAARNRVAALDADLGSATGWNPDATPGDYLFGTSVEAGLVTASGIHLGGFFARLLATDRDGLGAVSLSTGDGAAVGLAPAVLDLGEQAVGTSGTPRVVSLVNYGSTAVAITDLVVSGDFSETTDCTALLSPGGRCDVMVTFAPTAVGPRSGTVTVTTDAPGSPHLASIRGLGTAPGQFCCAFSAAGCSGTVSHTSSSTSSGPTFLRVDLPPPSPDATGPSVKVGEVFSRSTQTVSRTPVFGPSTILVGEGQGQACFVEPGEVNVNVNTHVHRFVIELFQATEVPPPLDHFVCYKSAAAKAPKGEGPFPKFAPTSVSAVDTLAARQLALTKPLVVCNPADKNGEDPTAPTHAAHLEGYQAKLAKTAPPQAKPAKTVVGVTNQLGPLKLQVKAPDRLLVPSAKALGTGGATPLGTTTVDHFTCYKAKVAKAPKGAPAFPVFTKASVTLADQFGGPLVYDLKKPTRVCLPADKNAESPGAADHPDRLVCYAAKLAKQKPPQTKFAAQTVSTANQFGAEVLRAKKLDELCVPSSADD